MEKITLFDPRIHGRRTIRVPGYDYSSPGYYFITICTNNRKRLFGRIRNGHIKLNRFGKIVSDIWKRTEYIRTNVRIDESIVMPDHIHGIIQITDERADVGARPGLAPTRNGGPHCPAGSVGAIVGSFKSESTKTINRIRGISGVRIWQRNFYERILYDDGELWWYRNYIRDNPKHWNR